MLTVGRHVDLNSVTSYNLQFNMVRPSQVDVSASGSCVCPEITITCTLVKIGYKSNECALVFSHKAMGKSMFTGLLEFLKVFTFIAMNSMRFNCVSIVAQCS